MSVNKVKKYLEQFNLADKIQEFEQSSATVKLAAQALNTSEAQIAKTISLKIDNKIILIVCAGDSKIDNTKYKQEFNTKPKMLDKMEVETLVGHPVGGVCPFAIDSDIEVYLDNSLKRFTHVYPACGSANSAIKLTIEQLEKLSNHKKWVDVCKLKD